ncbi:hypothetical protein MKX03_025133 [Papaver bracteatum]|nr:hypothetical protein MKX03_025133 [Papaver bracteatum]
MKILKLGPKEGFVVYHPKMEEMGRFSSAHFSTRFSIEISLAFGIYGAQQTYLTNHSQTKMLI